MLSMRVPREKDRQTLSEFLNHNALPIELTEEQLNRSMIAEEGKIIIGFVSYIQIEDVYKIDHLFIDPSFRRKKIGDGLLRALLNLIDRRGIREARIQIEPECIPFIEYVGLDLEDSEQGIYRALLPDFFEKPCRGEK